MVSENATMFLDLYDVFVNEIAGSQTLFLALSIIIILIFAIKFKFDNLTTVMMLVVWVIVISNFMNVLLAITLAIIGFFIASQINRLVTR